MLNTRRKPLRALASLSLVILFSAFLVYNTSLGKSVTSTIVVPDAFPSIQTAVDAADSGDTVFVRTGTYHENVAVNKSISLIGQDAGTTIIDGSTKGGKLLSITASNVTVAGFTVKSSINKGDMGIVLTGSNFCDISGNIVTECDNGVVLDSNSSNNLLFGNCIARSYGSGIRCLSGARSNRIVNNTVFRCGLAICMLESANENTVFHNNFTTNTVQVYCLSSPNIWDDGYPSGGNYWSDYMGLDLYKGSNQDILGSDGIGDTPYISIGGWEMYDVGQSPDPNNIDRYPFFVSGHETTVRFHLEPSSLTVRKGQTFNVTVYLDNMPEYPGFLGLQFDITWDSAVLNGVGMDDVLFHGVTPEGQRDNIWQCYHRVSTSFVSYAYLWYDELLAYVIGYSPIWGNHSVATIALKAVGAGRCSVDVETVKVASSCPQRLVCVVGYGRYDESLLNHSITGSTVEVKQRNPGDINGDGIVDALDSSALARAFGARLGELNYDEMADENEDGYIDIFDAVLLANSFGKTYA